MARAAPSPAFGGLSLIVICFLGSATLRLADSGQAFAEEIGNALAAEESGAQEAGAEEEEMTPARADALLLAIRDRERQLAERDAAITERAQALSVAETKLKEQLDAFEQAQRNLEETLAMADAAAENDIAQMTMVYENMKAADAARIFEQMDVSFAAGLMSRMRPEITASVLSSMEPDAAYAVTVMITGRNALVPTE